MAAKCKATDRNGDPCSAEARHAGYCIWHDPARAEERKAWRAKGGQARSNKARARKALPDGLKSMQEIQAMLTITLSGVLLGKVEPGVGNAAANIARAIKDLAGAAEMEERLAELERAVNLRRPA